MNIDNLVEVIAVFPSPMGGAVFKGVPIGERNALSYRASYKIILRIPKIGEYWRVVGDTIISREYGIVVIATSATLANLPSSKFIGNLLSKHEAFRGFAFGRAKVNKLLADIGDFALVELLNQGNYVAISDAGLNIEISKRVCKAWSGLKDETELSTFLAENNIDSTIAAKITRMCRYNLVARLKRNPFALIALSKSKLSILKLIGGISTKLGIPSEDVRASIGLVEFALYQQLERGHTMVALNNLKLILNKLRRIIGSKLSPDEIISAALLSKAVCVYEENGCIYIQVIGVAYIEQSAERILKNLQITPLQTSIFEADSGLSRRIAKYNTEQEHSNGFRLTDQQCNAVEMALTNRVSMLSGYGGTGKTTVLKAIVTLAEENGIAVHVCALAGKAADRARQAIRRDTFTIHNLIKKLKKRADKNDTYSVDRKVDPLIIIDEASMVDIALANSLFTAFAGHTFRLLIVGDTAQLPPIGFGLFWHVLIDSNIAKTHLTKVHRVFNQNPLHQTAMNIRNAVPHQLPVFSGQEKGIYILEPGSDLVKTVSRLRESIDAVTLTAFANERYTGSAKTINSILQMTLSNAAEEDSMNLGNVSIRLNDPVLATANVYGLEIFNGMTGIVKTIEVKPNGEAYCVVKFDGRESITLSKFECWDIGLDLAYAMTIHKSQGSEYDACIVCLSDRMERSGIYTAITRAKTLCVVVGTQKQFDNAILRQPIYERINCAFRI